MSVLIVLEQQNGQWHRMTAEGIAAGQQIGAALGVPVEAVMLGTSMPPAQTVTKAKLARVWSIEHALLSQYTADGYGAALEQLIRKIEPQLVLFPHTYQVRDFAPKLATRFSQVLVSDVIAVRTENGKLTLVRQFFQGKLNGDVRLSGTAPHFASLQAGAWSADQLQPGESPAPVDVFAPRVSGEIGRAHV